MNGLWNLARTIYSYADCLQNLMSEFQALICHLVLVEFFQVPALGMAEFANSGLLQDAIASAFPNYSITNVEDFKGNGGLSAEMQRVKVKSPDNSDLKKIIFKSTKEAGVVSSKLFGLAREGVFFENLDAFGAFNGFLPEIYYSKGDMNTGIRTILMKDLSEEYVQSGYFFGSHSPLNWGKDVETLSKEVVIGEEPVLKEIMRSVATIAGKLHGTYWNDSSLVQHKFLKNSEMYHDEGKEGWLKKMSYLQSKWTKFTPKIKDESTGAHWSPQIIELINASLSQGNDWERFSEALHGIPFTLVHGDFHPANMMVNKKDRSIMLLDFEMVGVGLGVVDLGQYMISHLECGQRKELESDFVMNYHQELCIHIGEQAENYTFDQCWSDYGRGGTEKWMFLLIILADMGLPSKIMQYFHDQVFDFATTHDVSASNIGPPRL